jgi:hypothetical protein
VNKIFVTPSRYVDTTLRVIWNGQVYEPDDDKWGWTELSDTEIETKRAPRTGDVLQAFYKEKETTSVEDVVVGSPFHPTDLYP